MSGDNQDLVALKKLLTSWNVGLLYELFAEEDITISELKMMQCSHVHALLRDHKMGVRIRFEYHFNKWRHKIGIPLRTLESNHNVACCCNSKGNFENHPIESHNTRSTTRKANETAYEDSKKRRLDQGFEAVDQTEIDENHPSSPQSVNSNTSLVNMLTSNELVNFMPIPGSPNEKSQHTDGEIDMENIPLQALGEFLSVSVSEKPSKINLKNTQEKYPANLIQILQKSGSRGMSIVRFFQEKNYLTSVHRSQLIQTIVDYFLENDYHLSLNSSHNLEWEILKMFPTEKLEYYRTEKRGKIYAKFSNMKRYKRERSIKARTEIENPNSRRLRYRNEEEAHVLVEGNEDDCWYRRPEPEVRVKEENTEGNCTD